MTAFSYTTGNPNNLVANQNASMADIQGPFTDIRTFINGGTMDETNVPNLAAAFTSYERMLTARAELTNPTGTQLAQLGYSANSNVGVATGFATISNHVVYLDPTIYAANSRTTKLNLRASVVPNAVAPAVNYTVGLYLINVLGGGSGSTPFVQSVNTVLSGSTATINAPAASTLSTATSGDFNFPAAGGYVIGIVPSAAAATNSVVAFSINLEIRRV